MNKRELINLVIDEIMILDGPDGHTDGSDKITDFVISILDNSCDKWFKKYYKRMSVHRREKIRKTKWL